MCCYSGSTREQRSRHRARGGEVESEHDSRLYPSAIRSNADDASSLACARSVVDAMGPCVWARLIRGSGRETNEQKSAFHIKASDPASASPRLPDGGAQLFLTAKLTMRGKAIELFLRDRALTLGTGPPKIAATEVDING